MFDVSSIQNKNLWKSLIDQGPLPSYFTEIINIDFALFKAKMEAQDLDFQSNLIYKMFEGSIIQIIELIKPSSKTSVI